MKLEVLGRFNCEGPYGFESAVEVTRSSRGVVRYRITGFDWCNGTDGKSVTDTGKILPEHASVALSYIARIGDTSYALYGVGDAAADLRTLGLYARSPEDYRVVYGRREPTASTSVDAELCVSAWREQDAPAKLAKLADLARSVDAEYDDMSFLRIRGNRALYAVQNDNGNGCHRELLSRAQLNAMLEI